MTVIDTHPCMQPPAVDDRRLGRFEDWVVEYVTSLRDDMVEKDPGVDRDALLTHLVGVAEEMRCHDIPEWMPLIQSIVVINIDLSFHPESVDADRLRNACRTFYSATQDERDEAVCYQLGLQKQSLSCFRDKAKRHAEPVDIDTGSPRCSLYRYFDDAGRLLYVGIANDPILRDEQHERSSRWYRFHGSRSVEWFDSRAEAMEAERDAIHNESPVFNLTHASRAQKASALDYLFDVANQPQ